MPPELADRSCTHSRKKTQSHPTKENRIRTPIDSPLVHDAVATGARYATAHASVRRLATAVDVDQPREVAGFRADRHSMRVNERNDNDQQNV